MNPKLVEINKLTFDGNQIAMPLAIRIIIYNMLIALKENVFYSDFFFYRNSMNFILIFLTCLTIICFFFSATIQLVSSTPGIGRIPSLQE